MLQVNNPSLRSTTKASFITYREYTWYLEIAGSVRTILRGGAETEGAAGGVTSARTAGRKGRNTSGLASPIAYSC